jgi:protoporphyrinogen oxidase
MAKKVLILGAGVSGLSAGWKLAQAGFDVEVCEKEDYIGGVSTTFRQGDCSLDYGPHKIYTQLDGVYSEIKTLLADELLEIPKRSRIMLKEKYFDFPVRMPQLMLGLSPLVMAGLGGTYIYALAHSKVIKANDPSYEAYIKNRFGSGLYNLIFAPYARKIWGEPSTLAASLAASRVSIPSLLELVKRTIQGDKGKKEISAAMFHYPKDGIIRLSEKMGEKIKAKGGKISFGKEAAGFNVEGGRAVSVRFADGISSSADYFISTMPVKNLIHSINPSPPQEVFRAADSLKHKNLILVYLVVARERLFPDNWIFYPEERYVFNRIFEQKGFSPSMIPANKTVLCAEITCDPTSKNWAMGEKEIIAVAVDHLEKAGILSSKEVVGSFTKRVENAYPVYDIGHERRRETVMSYLDGIPNLFSIGRLGYFDYVGMADCLDMGFRTAGHIASKGSDKEWAVGRKAFENYLTVD